MILAIEYKGKGEDKADYIKILQFKDHNEYQKYIHEHEDLDSKYWTYIEKINYNDGTEIYRHYY